MSEKTFTAIDGYKRGYFDGKLDDLFTLAATEGFVLLPGREVTRARCASYEVEDLLLPFNRKIYPSITAAYNAGMNIYPAWFTYDKGFFKYQQPDLCREFVTYYRLTRHKGSFLMDGEPVTDDVIREKLLRCLSIVLQDAGSKVFGTFAALRTICKDDEPPEKHQRLSIEALGAEMKERGFNIRLNLVTRKFEVTGTTGTGRDMQMDDLVMLLHNCLADTYKGCSFATIEQYLGFIGRENSYNPILELLSNTTYDGQSRIGQLYSLLGIEDDELSMALVLRWLFQTVALLFNDEKKDAFGADGVLTLVSEQGYGKTSFFKRLALQRAWFGEGYSIDDRDKDTIRRAITVWISELGEVGSTMKSDVDRLKAFVTQSVDEYRLPYGRTDIVSARHTSLCASCNPDEYLVDTTGNRRWWTIPLRRKIPHNELQSFDALQLWAEIYSLVAPLSYEQKAACFRLSNDEQEKLANRNRGFEKPMKGEVEVKDILSKAQTDGLVFREMTISEWKDHWSVLRPYSANQISQVLKKLGVNLRRTKTARLYELPLNFKTEQPFSAAL